MRRPGIKQKASAPNPGRTPNQTYCSNQRSRREMNMKCEARRLEEVCAIKTGTPIGRVRPNSDSDAAIEERVLVPRAMKEAGIIDGELVVEKVCPEKINQDFYTREDDVILKLSSPHDAVHIDAEHEGIIVTSFGMILRRKRDVPLNMRYLSLFLNHPQTNAMLQAISTGQSTSLSMLKRGAVADIEVPILPLERQDALASLFSAVQGRKQAYRKLIELDDELVSSLMTDLIWG